MDNIDLKLLTEKYPFITVFAYNRSTYVGIVQQAGKEFTSMYILERLSQEEHLELIQYANDWWNESNRTIPLHIFTNMYGGSIDHLSKSVMTFVSKPITILHGYEPQLFIQKKRSARRTIVKVS